jgi:Tol biopolymer transport system component
VKLTPLTEGTGHFESPSLSPSGKWIAFVTDGHLYKMPAQGGAPTQLTGSGSSDFSPAWSPDEKQIAFGSNEGGLYRVWVVDADGKNRRPFANTRLCPAPPYVTWWPGLRILYQASGFPFSLLDPQTGKESPLVPESSGDLRLAKYSPDGKSVAVHWRSRPQFGIWMISLTDGSQTPLLAGLAAPAGWSPDGKWIYAYLGNRMLSVAVHSRGAAVPHTVFSAPEGIGDSDSGIAEASVSPEGKTFVFSTTGRKSDVWVVDDWDSYQQR